MDTLDCGEISSILIDDEVQSVDKPCLNLLSDDLSSISSLSDSQAESANPPSVQPFNNVKSLTTSLESNLKVLQNTLKTLEDSTKKDPILYSDNKNANLILDELIGIKSHIENLKQKLRGSEDLISEKAKENFKLKEELKDLEAKTLTRRDTEVSCKHCSII
jgi:small-conductance mechanosensitive channel